MAELEQATTHGRAENMIGGEEDEEIQLPSVAEVRSRIEGCQRTDVRLCLMYLYMVCGRSCEGVYVSSPTDHSTARGPVGTDARKEVFRMKVGSSWVEEPAVVFAVKTAKRHGRVRNVALPLNYEPWAAILYRYFQDRATSPVFRFTRQLLSVRVREGMVFNGLGYPIESYTIKDGVKVDAKGKPLRIRVPRHPRAFALHALRHLRASELVDFHGFAGPELCSYGGWTLKSAGLPHVLDRYISSSWQGYFPKLLVRHD